METTIKVGDIFATWCSKHGETGKQTDHLWDSHKLICLVCHPEQDPRKEADNGSAV